MLRTSLLVSMATLALLCLAGQAAQAKPVWRLDRVVVVMRHGVRPPTKAQVMPQGIAADAWPSWDVPYGYLTHNGGRAVTQLGVFDRHSYAALVPSACPDHHQVRVVADTDQRTLKTAEIYAAALFPGCTVPVENAGAGQSDPRFSPFEQATLPDGNLMLASAQAAVPPGGLAAIDDANHALLTRLTAVLNPGCKDVLCDLAQQPTQFVVAKGRVKIDGGVDTGSTAGQVLMLEYADGKLMSEVGWGRADKALIRDALTLHALEFQLVARPKAIAAFGARPLLAEVKRGLFATDTAPYTVLVGHDSNLAYIGGALDIHWQGGDYPNDDPPPGGALIFEHWKDAAGHGKVVVRFRAQTMDEIRTLSPLTPNASEPVTVPACGGSSCTDEVFWKVLETIGE